MPLSVTAPPKINQQIHPVSSFVPKYADGYDVITVCDIQEKMTELLCIYENRIYYLVDATTSEYASYYTYNIYFAIHINKHIVKLYNMIEKINLR